MGDNAFLIVLRGDEVSQDTECEGIKRRTAREQEKARIVPYEGKKIAAKKRIVTLEYQKIAIKKYHNG